VTGTLGSFSRSLVISTSVVSALILGTVTLVSSALRRREVGRRRALGATRMTVFAMMVGQVFIGASLGSLGGGLISQIAVLEGGDGYAFTIGTCYLMVVMCCIGAIPGALSAALRDPVRVLRLP
jgi:putative ABC transport system permease protein